MPAKRTYLSIFWIAGYLLIPVMTPYFQALDANGPRLLTQSMWTLLGLLLFLPYNSTDRPRIGRFFQNPVGIAYGVFILMTILSGFPAVNRNEWLIQLSKLLPVFVATQIIFSLSLSDKGVIRPIISLFSVLLLVESIMVLRHTGQFIRGEVDYMSQFGWIYVNRNILAASIFIKIPAAFFVSFSENNWKKYLGFSSLSLGILSLFFLSSRGFYWGLLLIWVIIAFVGIALKLRKQGGRLLKSWYVLSAILLGAFIVFSLIQKNFYPPEKDWVTGKSVSERLQNSLQTTDNLRIDSWKRTGRLIKENPVLGVGAGNWKIRVLEYEAPEIPDFKYMYKNHNDFLEFMAETGIPGGLAYLAIFIIIMVAFLKKLIRDPITSETILLLLFPVLGLVAYSVDAFFNFPGDRPVIQSLFAIMLGIGMSLLSSAGQKFFKKPHMQSLILWMFYLLILPALIWLNVLQLKSLRIQRIVKEDIVNHAYTKPADFFMDEYPDIPDINVVGTPIVIDQVRYLLHENRDEEIRVILNKDHSSPFDIQKPYYLGMIFLRQNQPDSARNYLEQVYEQKPLFTNGVFLYTEALSQTGKRKEAIEILQEAIERQAGDTLLIVQLERLTRRTVQEPPPLFLKAKEAYDHKEYKKAIPLITELLKSDPDFVQLYRIRALCYYHTGDYVKAIKDIDQFADKQKITPELKNLKEVCLERAKK